MSDPQNPNRPADDVDPKKAAQLEQARKAIDLKRQTPPDPRFGTQSSDSGIQPTEENLEAQRQDSAKIGGGPEALGRSHGVRQSDQG